MSESDSGSDYEFEEDGIMDEDEYGKAMSKVDKLALRGFLTGQDYGKIPGGSQIPDFFNTTLKFDRGRKQVESTDKNTKIKSTFDEYGGDFMSLVQEARDAFDEIQYGETLVVDSRVGAGRLQIKRTGTNVHEVTLMPSLDFFYELHNAEKRCETFLGIKDVGQADSSNFFFQTHLLMEIENAQDTKEEILVRARPRGFRKYPDWHNSVLPGISEDTGEPFIKSWNNWTSKRLYGDVRAFQILAAFLFELRLYQRNFYRINTLYVVPKQLQFKFQTWGDLCRHLDLKAERDGGVLTDIAASATAWKNAAGGGSNISLWAFMHALSGRVDLNLESEYMRGSQTSNAMPRGLLCGDIQFSVRGEDGSSKAVRGYDSETKYDSVVGSSSVSKSDLAGLRSRTNTAMVIEYGKLDTDKPAKLKNIREDEVEKEAVKNAVEQAKDYLSALLEGNIPKKDRNFEDFKRALSIVTEAQEEEQKKDKGSGIVKSREGIQPAEQYILEENTTDSDASSDFDSDALYSDGDDETDSESDEDYNDEDILFTPKILKKIEDAFDKRVEQSERDWIEEYQGYEIDGDPKTVIKRKEEETFIDQNHVALTEEDIFDLGVKLGEGNFPFFYNDYESSYGLRSEKLDRCVTDLLKLCSANESDDLIRNQLVLIGNKIVRYFPKRMVDPSLIKDGFMLTTSLSTDFLNELPGTKFLDFSLCSYDFLDKIEKEKNSEKARNMMQRYKNAIIDNYSIGVLSSDRTDTDVYGSPIRRKYIFMNRLNKWMYGILLQIKHSEAGIKNEPTEKFVGKFIENFVDRSFYARKIDEYLGNCAIAGCDDDYPSGAADYDFESALENYEGVLKEALGESVFSSHIKTLKDHKLLCSMVGHLLLDDSFTGDPQKLAETIRKIFDTCHKKAFGDGRDRHIFVQDDCNKENEDELQDRFLYSPLWLTGETRDELCEDIGLDEKEDKDMVSRTKFGNPYLNLAKCFNKLRGESDEGKTEEEKLKRDINRCIQAIVDISMLCPLQYSDLLYERGRLLGKSADLWVKLYEDIEDPNRASREDFARYVYVLYTKIVFENLSVLRQHAINLHDVLRDTESIKVEDRVDVYGPALQYGAMDLIFKVSEALTKSWEKFVGINGKRAFVGVTISGFAF